MVAIYGLVGDAGRAELEAMAARLAHRGAIGAHWSPAPGVWFGMQSRVSAELATEGSLLFAANFSRPKESARSSAWRVRSPLRGGGAATER
jgi:hypothetical protein